AGDELHGVERRAVGPAAGFIDRDDAGMLEARGDQRLAQEADLADVIARDQLLDGDVASEVDVVRARHAAQATAAVLAEDVVALGVAGLAAGHGGGRGGGRRAGYRRRVAGARGLRRRRGLGCERRVVVVDVG